MKKETGKISKRLALAALSLALTSSAEAFAQVELGQIAVGGTGCPAGTAMVLLSPDLLSVQVRYSQFEAVAGGTRGIDRKACSLAIPLQLPPGLSVALINARYVGIADVSDGASAQITTESFIAGSQGPKVSRTITGPAQGGFMVVSSVDTDQRIFSGCGESVILRTNTSVVAQSSGAPARIRIEASDLQAGVVYDLSYRGCGPNPYPVPTRSPVVVPTVVPTIVPTALPTAAPTSGPTGLPTVVPGTTPTDLPTSVPTSAPTLSPEPSPIPTITPSTIPLPMPTAVPTVVPPSDPILVLSLKLSLKHRHELRVSELAAQIRANLGAHRIKAATLIISTAKRAKVSVLRGDLVLSAERLHKERKEIRLDLNANPADASELVVKTKGRVELVTLRLDLTR